MRAPVRLIGLSGSLRKASYNTAVLRSLAEQAPAGVEFSIVPLDDIPLYNQDHDGERRPAAVAALRSAIEACDGIVVSSPEYNYGMSGVLKNAIDWASRPAHASPLKGKPVLAITASVAFTGGARAQAHLREAFAATESRVLARPQVVIAGAREKFADGRLTDEPTRTFLGEALRDLIEEIAMLHGCDAVLRRSGGGVIGTGKTGSL